jgi:hypothetical protein
VRALGRGGATVAVTEHGHDTAELEADPGDVLTVVERDDEMLVWCRGVRAREGWVPFDKTEPVEMGGAPPRSTWRPKKGEP